MLADRGTPGQLMLPRAQPTNNLGCCGARRDLLSGRNRGTCENISSCRTTQHCSAYTNTNALFIVQHYTAPWRLHEHEYLSRARRHPLVSQSLGTPPPAAQPGRGLRLSTTAVVGLDRGLVCSVARWALLLDGDRPRSLPLAVGGGTAPWAVVAGTRGPESGRIRDYTS